MADLHCSVLTPEGPYFEGEVASVTAPGADGQMGVLKGHAPLVTSLGFGPLYIRKEQGAKPEAYFLVGGFMEVYKNKVAILARFIERLDELDEAVIRAHMESGEKIEGYDAKLIGSAKLRFMTDNKGDIYEQARSA